jgi:hypothetical protein
MPAKIDFLTVVSYRDGDIRHRLVLVDHEDGSQKCVDSMFPHDLYTNADFLKNGNDLVFQRVIYLKNIGMLYTLT